MCRFLGVRRALSRLLWRARPLLQNTKQEHRLCHSSCTSVITKF